MPEPQRARERQQAHAAQHPEQPARHRRGRVRGRGPRLSRPPGPRPALPHQEVPQVTAGGQRQQPPGAAAAARARAGAALGPGQEAGEEEEGTGDAEEGAEAERADAQQGPQPGGAGSPALKPRAEQQGEDKGGQGAQREARPGEGGAAPRLQGGGRRRQQQLHVAEAAEVEEEAARGVLPQGAHAALHVAVPQALGGRAGPVRRRRAPHGFRVSLVPPHGPDRGGRGLGSARSRSLAPRRRFRGAPVSQHVRAVPAAAARGPRRAGGGAAGSATCRLRTGAAGASLRDRFGRPLLFPRTPLGTGDAASPACSRGLQQLPHGPSLVRWARERRAGGAPPSRLPRPGARPARRPRARAPSRCSRRRSPPAPAGTPATERARAGRARHEGGRGPLRMGGAKPAVWDPGRSGSLWE